VREDMALVRSATGAHDLGPDHAVAAISYFPEITVGEGRGEAGPAGAAFELRATLEQGQTAQPAGVDSLSLFGEEYSAEWRFRPMFEQHTTLVLAETRGQLSQLFLTGRAQIEWRNGDVFHAFSPWSCFRDGLRFRPQRSIA